MVVRLGRCDGTTARGRRPQLALGHQRRRRQGEERGVLRREGSQEGRAAHDVRVQRLQVMGGDDAVRVHRAQRGAQRARRQVAVRAAGRRAAAAVDQRDQRVGRKAYHRVDVERVRVRRRREGSLAALARPRARQTRSG